MATTKRPPLKLPADWPPGWVDWEPPRWRARLGRFIGRMLAAAAEHDAWGDRRAADRLAGRMLPAQPRPAPPPMQTVRKWGG